MFSEQSYGKWHHYLFTLNQKTGEFYVYIDGNEVAIAQSKPNLIYGAQAFQFAKMHADLDDFMIFNEYMEPKEVTELRAGNFVEPIYPKHNQHFVSNKNLVFDMIRGEGIVNSQLVLRDYKKKKVVKVKPLSDGSFAVPELTPNAKYVWNVISKTKDSKVIRSEPNLFYTSLELIENGSFEDNADKFWKGNFKILKQEKKKNKNGIFYISNKVVSGEKSLSMWGNAKITKTFKRALKSGKGYIFKGLANYGKGAAKLDVTAYAINGSGGKKVLANAISNRAYNFGVQFKTPKNLNSADLVLEIESIPHKPRKEPWALLDNLSMVEVDAKDVNLAPTVMKGLDTKKFDTKVGTIGYAIDLNDFVKDPEGSSVTYEKLSGPAWADIQSNDLFAAFGPTAEFKGQDSIFEIIAIDRAGNRTNFKITISVN